MPPKIQPLLQAALDRIECAPDNDKGAFLTTHFGGDDQSGRLPIVAQLPILRPKPDESWQDYRERVLQELRPSQARLEKFMGIESAPLIIANALQLSASPDQIRHLDEDRQTQIEMLQLDPVVQVTMMDDVVGDIDLDGFARNHSGTSDGNGVRVAVLDSGIDVQHPYLNVSASESTCGEDVAIPGIHGTHCAGSIASRDAVFRGVAPEVTLLNIKVLRADGSGNHTNITKGIDKALDLNAMVLSMSLGFNHLPTWSANGHGWTCSDGRCTLCTAVDNAVALDNTVVVVAAGNEHAFAQYLRSYGQGNLFKTELRCPGQAREALTVGGVTKRGFHPAFFSSHGPTADGREKPDLSAPCVNITSTVPMPRDSKGVLEPHPQRNRLFGRLSGTSMAAPIVAGAAALLIQRKRSAGKPWRPSDVKRELTTRGVLALGLPKNEVGAGCLKIGGLGP